MDVTNKKYDLNRSIIYWIYFYLAQQFKTSSKDRAGLKGLLGSRLVKILLVINTRHFDFYTRVCSDI